ncbi:chemotaxis protein CheW [Dactylosporangium sp. CA-092794]|uniref:chemotaxis protein CheW n=1 Tax=Dactylosporangium sp. CA-092794 TaxID=3239929 RepID=UPI003D8D2F87
MRMQDQLIFGVGRVLCALPLANVVETVRPLPVQPVASGGGALLGVAVIRGAAVPVVDTARLLGDPAARPTRFVTTATGHGTVAFATGDVVGVRAVAPDPVGRSPAAGSLVVGVGVLDGRPLLFLRGNLEIDRFLREVVVPPAAANPAATAAGGGAAVAWVGADPAVTAAGRGAVVPPAGADPAATAAGHGVAVAWVGADPAAAGRGAAVPWVGAEPAGAAAERRADMPSPAAVDPARTGDDSVDGSEFAQIASSAHGAKNDDMSEKSGACAGLFVTSSVGGVEGPGAGGAGA